MTDLIKTEKNKILAGLAAILDITPTQIKEAIARYKSVGEWLGKEESSLNQLQPEVYPQGSFVLGTVIRPLSDEDEFDIDLVCELLSSKSSYTQKQIKNLVGDRLKAHADYRRMLDKEGRRCWKLNYADSTRFHMDVLPAIPDTDFGQLNKSISYDIRDTAISITDMQHRDYSILSRDWHSSNPNGYALWFRQRMKSIFATTKDALASSRSVKIETINDLEVRTPLQQAIQILKRHRDIYYGDDEDKPISIIITTLSALAYEGEDNVYDTLHTILTNMRVLIGSEEVGGQKIWTIPNPVNPAENFADKWVEVPRKQRIFFEWAQKAEKDIFTALDQGTLPEMLQRLKKHFGDRIVNKVAQNMGDKYRTQREANKLMFSSVSGGLSQTGDKEVKNHKFYGVG